MSRVLITGVAGLLGSHLAGYLLNHTDDEILGVDNLSCGSESNIPYGLRWEQLTLGAGCLSEVVAGFRPDIICHFAAYAAECLSPFARMHNYRNNLLATAEVVNACLNHDVKRLVYTSSMAVYGRGMAPFHERDRCQPIDPYGNAKLACERDIHIAGEQHGLEWVILRPHNVYGPGQVCTQRYRNVFGIWMWRHMHGLPLLVYGDGTQQRAFSYIEDMVPCLRRAMLSDDAKYRIINLGGCVPVTLNQAAHTLLQVVGGGEIVHAESRHEVQEAWCTTERSQELLGFVDATPLEEGLRKMWMWAKTAQHAETSLPQIEVRDGLPSYWL